MPPEAPRMDRPFEPPPSEQDACPACGTGLRDYCFESIGEARCPRCDTALWHITFRDRTTFLECTADPVIKDRILDFLAKRLKITRHELQSNPRAVQRLSSSSLSMVEIVLESYEAMDMEGPW